MSSPLKDFDELDRYDYSHTSRARTKKKTRLARTSQKSKKKPSHSKSKRGKYGQKTALRHLQKHSHPVIRKTRARQKSKSRTSSHKPFRLIDYYVGDKRGETLRSCARYLTTHREDRPPVINNLPQGSCIYAVGDIHGDLQLLQVILVEILQVVKATVRIPSAGLVLPITDVRRITDDLSGDSESPFTIHHKGKDYPVTIDNTYYQWCGPPNSYIVFCGDLLDRARQTTVKDREGKTPGEIKGEEDLILGFLNLLSVEALRNGSQVIKLIGNHEGINVIEALRISSYDSYTNDRNPYATSYSKKHYLERYGKNRREHFLPGGPGSEDILACSGYPIVKLGDFIFVHGGILPGIVKYMVKQGQTQVHPKDDFLYRADQHSRASMSDKELSLKGRSAIHHVADTLLYQGDRFKGMGKTDNTHDWSNGVNSILWERRLGEERVDPVKQCRYLKDTFTELGYDVPGNHNTRLVVAHCPTMYRGHQDPTVKSGYLYNQVESEDHYRYVLATPTKYNFPCPNGITVPTGITTDCFCGDDHQERLFRIDVAASRAFDDSRLNVYYPAHVGLLRYMLQARRPQALQIKVTGEGKYQTRVLMATRGLTRKWLKQAQTSDPKWQRDEAGKPVSLNDVGPIDFTQAVSCQAAPQATSESD